MGVALLAGGAGVAMASATGATLLKSLGKNDDASDPPKNPELTQIGGFVSLSLLSVGAGAALVGGALLLE